MVETTVPPPTDTPSPQAIMTAYQVTARLLVGENQLIWSRTALFVALNGLVATALHYVTEIPGPVRLLVSILGCVYSVCWHVSMARMWQYHRYFIRMIREQEQALGLDQLGVYSRGRAIAEGTVAEVGGERTHFTPGTLIFRANFLANLVTFAFVLVYAVFAIHYGLQVAK